MPHDSFFVNSISANTVAPAPNVSTVPPRPGGRETDVGARLVALVLGGKRKARRGQWAALLLLAVYAGLSWTAALQKGVAFDEGLQLAVGYNLWLNDDYRMEGANGDLVKRWATLPFLVTRPRFVSTDDPVWKQSRAYDLGWRFMFELGNSPEALLRISRAMVVLLGVAAGALVFVCSRELFGTAGGLLSLVLFVFSPSMLEFGAVVSTDMSITLTLLAATWSVWRVLHRVTAARIVTGVCAVSLLVLAKPTALVMFPIAAVLVAVRLAGRRPLELRWGAHARQVRTRRAQAAIIALLATLHVATAWAALWAHYGFRYGASPRPDDPTCAFFNLPSRDAIPPAVAAIVNVVEHTHFLPEGFHVGIRLLLECDDQLGAFMNNRWKLGGWAAFFPFTIWAKTPPAVFALLALAAIAWWKVRPRGGGAAGSPGSRGPRSPPALYEFTPYLALAACFLAVAMTEDLNIGHRHVLPIYPALYILAGGAALFHTRRLFWPCAVAACIAAQAIDSFSVRPDYLAYFSPLVGGPSQGYKKLVDSSLDWGMDLPGLKSWLDQNDPGHREPLFLGYFGNDNPEHYGIEARRLPGFFERRRPEIFPYNQGYYAISASLLQGVYTAAFGPWSRDYERRYQTARRNASLFTRSETDRALRAQLLKRASIAHWCNEMLVFDNLRFARLCAWLRHQGDPPHHVGHSIFIWKLNHAQLDAALLGPPAELVNAPPVLRSFREFAEATQ